MLVIGAAKYYIIRIVIYIYNIYIMYTESGSDQRSARSIIEFAVWISRLSTFESICLSLSIRNIVEKPKLTNKREEKSNRRAHMICARYIKTVSSLLYSYAFQMLSIFAINRVNSRAGKLNNTVGGKKYQSCNYSVLHRKKNTEVSVWVNSSVFQATHFLATKHNE